MARSPRIRLALLLALAASVAPSAPLSAQSPESKIPATTRYIALVKPAPHKGLSIFLELAGRFPEEEFLFIGGRPPGAFPSNGVVRA